MTHTLTLKQTISATQHAVYRAFTTPGGQMDWFANAAEVDARIGGRFYVWTEGGYQAMGIFSELEEDRHIAIDLYNPDPTRLRIDLSGKNGETELTLEQMDLKDEETLEATRRTWEASLSNLKSVLETGIDRRFYDRPMLGVLIGGGIDQDNFKRYKLPGAYGIILAGTVSGMGAEAAGLREDDVLVEMDGIQLDDYYDLQRAVRPHKAGDTIPIAWYRDGERCTADMRLSGRPIPEIPPTPSELADQIEQLYARLDAELAETLEGVTEAEAEYRPAESEWSIKEILAHIITTERALQLWIANTAEGELLMHWGSNDNGLIKSLVDTLQTIPELTAEIHRSEYQTVALLRQLPAEIVDHQGAYHDIASTLGSHGMTIHTRLHYETIKNQIEAAREI